MWYFLSLSPLTLYSTEWVCDIIKNETNTYRSHECDMTSGNCVCPEDILEGIGRFPWETHGPTPHTEPPSPLPNRSGSFRLGRAAPKRRGEERATDWRAAPAEPPPSSPPLLRDASEPPRPRSAALSEGKPYPEQLRRRSPSAYRPPRRLVPSESPHNLGEPTAARLPATDPSLPGSPSPRSCPRARGRLRAYLRWSKEWMLRAAFPCPPPTQLRERPNMLAANSCYGPGKGGGGSRAS